MWLIANTTSADRGMIYGRAGDEVTMIKQNDPRDMTLVCDTDGNQYWTRTDNLTDKNPNKKEDANNYIVPAAKGVEAFKEKARTKKSDNSRQAGLFG